MSKRFTNAWSPMLTITSRKHNAFIIPLPKFFCAIFWSQPLPFIGNSLINVNSGNYCSLFIPILLLFPDR